MTKRTLVVNFYGGPGAGKSTMAAGVFFNLKMSGFNCELVTEFAKDLTWEERFGTLSNQVFVSGEQIHRIHRLLGKVDVIVSDSPILLGVFYTPDDYPASFRRFMLEVDNRMDSLNYLLLRDPNRPYEVQGRKEDPSRAMHIDDSVQEFLTMNGVSFQSIPGHVSAIPQIMADIEEALAKMPSLAVAS